MIKVSRLSGVWPVEAMGKRWHAVPFSSLPYSSQWTLRVLSYTFLSGLVYPNPHTSGKKKKKKKKKKTDCVITKPRRVCIIMGCRYSKRQLTSVMKVYRMITSQMMNGVIILNQLFQACQNPHGGQFGTYAYRVYLNGSWSSNRASSTTIFVVRFPRFTGTLWIPTLFCWINHKAF